MPTPVDRATLVGGAFEISGGVSPPLPPTSTWQFPVLSWLTHYYYLIVPQKFLLSSVKILIVIAYFARHGLELGHIQKLEVPAATHEDEGTNKLQF